MEPISQNIYIVSKSEETSFAGAFKVVDLSYEII